MRATLTTWRDPRLRWALGLALLLHGALLTAGSYRGSYDAWVHIFFGDHYARDWFSTWEPRWYTGFTVTSYPPASHQAIGLFSRLIGLEAAFVVLQIAAVLNIVVGVYRFSMLWVSREAAGWAALLAVVSSSLAEVVHTFGQLPTTFALGFLLNAQPSIRRWVHQGVRVDLVAAIALLAATTAGHHVTTLFGTVFFTGPVVVRAVLDRWGTPIDNEPVGHLLRFRFAMLRPQVARRLRRVLPATMRAGVLGVIIVATLITVVLPYWLWSSSDPITQVPIPHASRNSFIEDTAAGLIFWLVPWASLLLLAPFAIVRAAIGRGWPLAASIALLALLGTGGTTPIPRLLLGGAFDILTLDRFTVWATIALLPFAGWVVASLRGGALARVGQARIGQWVPQGFLFAVIMMAIGTSVFAATLTSHRPFQPRAVDPKPIAAFMEKDQHDRWRYLTLGFGDQMAWVAANTTALTVDGNYHSARRLPELTTRSVERLEGAKYRGVAGIGSLQQFLINPSPYHLKFVFSIDNFYDPLLWSSGWQRIGLLDNDVEVWERADVAPLPDVLPIREIPDWQRVMWGVLPPLSVCSGVVVLMWIGLRRRLPRRLRWLGLPIPGAGRLLRRVDRRLERWAEPMREPGLIIRLPWSPLRPYVEGALRRAEAPNSTCRRRLLQVTLIGLVVAPLATLFVVRTDQRTPSETIEAFYSSVDFQQFGAAHALLDPDDRPELSEYLLGISLRDGLVGGYSELDAVRSTIVQTGDVAVAEVELVFVTSVEEYRVRRSHRLVQRLGEWFIEPDPKVVQPPVDQLVVRPEVAVSTLGRSVATTARTSFDDILDRPRLTLGESRTYRQGDRWVVVGTVTNIDVDPADVTVSGVLRDADGFQLASYDANQSSVHQVLPGETVPYRIDFEERAGAFNRDDPAAGDFDPLGYAAPVFEAEVATVEVESRAVITGGQLERVLDIAEAQVVSTVGDGANGIDFNILLRNTGTISATVPRVSVTYLDSRGRAVWVDHHWVPDSVRPQRSTEVAWTSQIEALVEVDVPILTFDNVKAGGEEGAGVGAIVTLDVAGDPLVVAGREVSRVRLDVTSFQRQAAP
ncbi:MAG: hypothetical protein ACI89G_000905 [Minisyncoccia bacterium]